jgi:transcriptional regulator with XRE-family HTH domain
MNQLKSVRERKNLTQEEVAEQSGLSVRTIQRVEAGAALKGYTLKTLAQTLDVNEQTLLGMDALPPALKWINLSSLLLLPPLNMLAPWLLARYLKVKHPVVGQLISLQVFWTIMAPIVFFLGIFLKLGNGFTMVLMCGIVLSNVALILWNAYGLDQKGKLSIKLNFNIL